MTLKYHAVQFECLLAGSIAPDFLQVLYSQGSSAVQRPILLVQGKKLALLHVRVLLLCQHPVAA